MRAFLVAGALALTLAGCQTPEQSLSQAEVTCQTAGLRPGSAQFNRCRNANYAQNRANSDAVAGAVVAGAAAGIIGGAIVASSARPRYYYGPGYYRRGYYRPYYY